MFESLLDLKKKQSSNQDEKCYILVQYFLVGPFLLIATLTLALFKHCLSLYWPPVWSIGFVLSLGCGFLITILSFREGAAFLSLASCKDEEREREACRLESLLRESADALAQKKERSKVVMEMLHGRMLEAEAKADSFEELASLKKYEWEALEEEKEALFQEKVSVQQELLELMRELDTLPALREKLESLTQEKHLFKNHLQEQQEQEQEIREELSKARALPPPPHPYDELKKQFEEKAGVLNATRKELFAIEGKYLALQKEVEDKLLEPHQEVQKLLEQFTELGAYCSRLEEDLKQHQELLTEVSVKKTVRKKRKTTPKKVKVNETVVADLFSEKTIKAKANT